MPCWRTQASAGAFNALLAWIYLRALPETLHGFAPRTSVSRQRDVRAAPEPPDLHELVEVLFEREVLAVLACFRVGGQVQVPVAGEPAFVATPGAFVCTDFDV